MKPTRIIFVCAALAAAALVFGCARPPTDEMNQAAEAVARAENDINAVTYAANLLARARDSLSRMYAEADARRFDSARNLAAEAQDAALRAIEEGHAGAARARDAAAALVSDLRPLIAETERGINAAKAADLYLDYDALGRDFDAARYNADQAQINLAAGLIDEADERARAARSGLNGINNALSAAALAVGRGK